MRSRLRPARRRPVPVKHRCRVAGLRSCRWGDDLQGRLAAAIPLAFFVLLFRSKCELFLIGGFRPLGRVHFLCSAKENEPKERRTRRLAPPHTDGVQRGSLRSSEKPARAQLADLADARFGLEQGARLPRFFLRCSAAPTGLKTTHPNSVGKSSDGCLFGHFLLAAQEKVPRPKGAKQNQLINRTGEWRYTGFSYGARLHRRG